MSNFTTQVRSICETYAGYLEPQGLDKVDEIIRQTSGKIIGQYPLFDEGYRNVLNDKIIKHFYMREIGMETVGQWRLKLNTKMNEIMPYYNKLYKSELLEFNPFYDVDLTTDRKREEEKNGTNSETKSGTMSETGTSSENGVTERSFSGDTQVSSGTESESSNTNSSQSTGTQTGDKNKSHTDRYSDTPQGGINGMQSVEQNLYLTNARLIGENEHDSASTTQNTSGIGSGSYQETKTDSEQRTDNETIGSEKTGEVSRSGENSSESNGESAMNTIEDYAEHVYGKRGGGSMSKLLMEFRETMLNIDMLIIDELEDLFFQLWE